MAPLPPPSSWLLKQAERLSDQAAILDFAAGYGRHCRALDQTFPNKFIITAVDRDADALALIKKAVPTSTVICTDLEAETPWPFASRRFDAVLVTNYLFRPKLAMLFDLVVVGGYLFYETFADGNAAFGKPSNPDYLLKPDELPAAMPAAFEQIDYFHGKVTMPRAAMIQRFAARRRS